MRKEYKFKVGKHQIKITNSWSDGAKLYVDGDMRDMDRSKFANGNYALLSANLGEQGVLEIYPESGFFTVSMTAFLIVGDKKSKVYSA